MKLRQLAKVTAAVTTCNYVGLGFVDKGYPEFD